GLLGPGETTVGVHVDVMHKAATPPGMRVTFSCELTEVSANGKGLTFRVEARDEAGIIGEGMHRRVVVQKADFEARTRSKGGGARPEGGKNSGSKASGG
ncbi:MAG: hypothetical protein K2G99_01330, partial [Desulfovibrio sp.]|nr:hypothetical protein [Desulfovibrio sp.]